MNFIKRMKKREFIEMGLKALASFFAVLVAIILMEGMIYGIELNALKTKGKNPYYLNTSTTAYCIKEGEDKYFVIYHNEGGEKEWSAMANSFKTKAECLALEGNSVKEVVMHAPNAFEFSITPVHYVVMGVVVAAVAGFFAYKFITLKKEYDKIEDTFKKTGTIELGNM